MTAFNQRCVGALDSVPGYRAYRGGMRTSQVAEQAGVNVQTLRYYERRGLLPEPPRGESGYRVYGPDVVRRVRFVKRAQELGFGLSDAESLLALAAGGPESCEAARELAATKVAELDRRIADLVAMRDSLERLVATCLRPRAERECPLLHSIEEAADER
jgi:Hg(II)-responsive transcriptional regulator